jgi:hypothetical protein
MPKKPLKTVMIRRGQSEVNNVSSQNLITFIRKKVLLGSDELSGDGKDWIRVDRHYQLKKYFPEEESKNDSVEMVNLRPPPGLTNNLEELADLLKDINN